MDGNFISCLFYNICITTPDPTSVPHQSADLEKGPPTHQEWWRAKSDLIHTVQVLDVS